MVGADKMGYFQWVPRGLYLLGIKNHIVKLSLGIVFKTYLLDELALT
jgi:hypothetical protein